SRQPHKDVNLAHVDELTKKVIRKKCIFRQLSSPCEPMPCRENASRDILLRNLRLDPAQPKPEELIRPHGQQVRQLSYPGKNILPNISIGIFPLYRRRSSSTACAAPERLLTTSTDSLPSRRTYANIL